MGKTNGWLGPVFAAAIVGAVLPDIDLLFFYFVDDRAIHHHRYWVHVPFFWAVLASVTLPVLWTSRYRLVAIAFIIVILMHLALDSIGGGIMWLAPFNTELVKLVTVQPTQSLWIFSFLPHWTFLFEVPIWIFAGYLYLKDRRHGTVR